MRRILAIASLTTALVASLATIPPAQAAPQPAQDLRGTTVQQSLFGMHVFDLEDGVWPTVPMWRRRSSVSMPWGCGYGPMPTGSRCADSDSTA